MMEKPIIVLHVVGKLNIGGAESRIMDLYRNIDRDKVQFHFVQHTTQRCAFEEEVEQLGGRVYSVPRFNVKNYFTYKRAWKELFAAHPEIKVIQGHMTSTASIYLPIAKKAGVEITIAHARSAGVDPGLKGILTRFLRRDLYKKCDYRFTCSKMAGEAVFGNQEDRNKKAIFIPNAIDVNKFRYDENTRNQIRYELGLSDKFVIGHVGRFSHMKNHEYMLQILGECVKREKEERLPQTMLMFLGDGELREKMMEMAAAMGITSRVLFMGNKKDVYRYYQAMDYFLLPSLYEGLPGTVIEAQASGLTGIMSDSVTDEAIVTDLIQMRSIKEPAAIWAEEIVRYSRKWVSHHEEDEMQDVAETRDSYAEEVKKASFDVKEQAKRMQEFYLTGNLR